MSNAILTVKSAKTQMMNASVATQGLSSTKQSVKLALVTVKAALTKILVTLVDLDLLPSQTDHAFSVPRVVQPVQPMISSGARLAETDMSLSQPLWMESKIRLAQDVPMTVKLVKVAYVLNAKMVSA